MKSSLIISSHQSTVKVSSTDFDLSEVEESDFLRSYIPALHFDPTDKAVDLNVSKGEPGFEVVGAKATLSCPSFDQFDVITAVEYLLEKERQQDGIYCLHGSSASTDKGAVVFWGPATGTGKTSLMLSMVESGDGKFYSDEKILIELESNKVVGGTGKINLNKDYLKKNFTFQTDGKTEKAMPLLFMVYPVMTAESSGLYSQKWEPLEIEWHLYEELSRKIRGTSRRFCKMSVPAISLDEPSTAQKRSDSVKKFSQKTDCYYLRGGRKEILQKINALIKGEVWTK